MLPAGAPAGMLAEVVSDEHTEPLIRLCFFSEPAEEQLL